MTKSTGNMYEWVSHMHAHIVGACKHECRYCYVQNSGGDRNNRYKGEPALDRSTLITDYGKDNVIFVDHLNDLFEASIPRSDIDEVIRHSARYLQNGYVFQTKNPGRYREFAAKLDVLAQWAKHGVSLGTTVETNRNVAAFEPQISRAPEPWVRLLHLSALFNDAPHCKRFVTIEPILDFDVYEFVRMLTDTKPDFVNIGADSKGCGLPEPSKEKVIELVAGLREANIVIKKKHNLERLVGDHKFE